MPRIRIRTPEGERIVGTSNCSTLSVQLTAHAHRPLLQLNAEAKLTAGERVLQRWTWTFSELDSRATVELISEPGNNFDPPDTDHEPQEPDTFLLNDVDIDFEAATKEFAKMAESIQRLNAEVCPPVESEPLTHHCSFCGKGYRDVRKLIAGPSVAICDECISTANDLVNEK